MPIVDRHQILDHLTPRIPLVLELGCGNRRRCEGSLTIDQRNLPAVDLVGDVFEILARLPDACSSEIISSHFLEHVDDLPRLLGELARVLRNGGRMRATVPHYSNPYFYSDPTHERRFGLYTFSYFARDPVLARRVPRYDATLPFVIESLRLEFRSPAVFPFRRWVRRGVTRVLNLSVWSLEFYEENLSQVFPCYEIAVVLRREPR